MTIVISLPAGMNYIHRLSVMFTEVHCAPLPTPKNAEKPEKSVRTLSEVMFNCKPGFQLMGNQTLKCELDGLWDSPPPVCLGKESC